MLGMVRDLIDQAVGIVGSQHKLAEACHVKQASIWQAKEANRVSAELALAIDHATSGLISRRALRPDLNWDDAERAS